MEVVQSGRVRPSRRRRARKAASGGAALVVVASAAVAIRIASGRAGSGELSVGDAILLGLIEGLTEWLPISSTGHLTVAQSLLGISGAAADSYVIAIQAGAILAVLGLYRARFAAMARGLLGADPAGRRTLVSVAVASLPAGIVGLVFNGFIKQHLFGPWPVVAAWFVGGLAILVAARLRRHQRRDSGVLLAALSWRGAAVIGVAQALALWPGVSRSLVTILAATAVGLSLPAAVEFSFLLGFVILGAATLYETLLLGDVMVAAYGYATPLLGLAVAFVAAVGAMRWMVNYLNRHGLAVFGWYRIGIAVVTAALLLWGVI